MEGREIWVLLPPRDDEGDLTTYPGGWWQGQVFRYFGPDDPRAVPEQEGIGPNNVVFYFEDDDGDGWEVNLPLYYETYDPYIDPLSDSVHYAWYLVEI